MKTLRKWLALMMALMCALGMTLSVAASGNQGYIPELDQITDAERAEVYAMLDALPANQYGYVYNWVTGDLTEIKNPNARFTYLNAISAGIEDKGSIVHCSASVSIYTGHEVDMVMTLQSSNSSTSGYENIKYWYKTATKVGTTTMDNDRAVMSGKYYRSSIIGNVLNAKGQVLESATKKSYSVKI